MRDNPQGEPVIDRFEELGEQLEALPDDTKPEDIGSRSLYPDTCQDCGRAFEDGDTRYELQWIRKNGSERAGTGWLTYCEDCRPVGIPPE